MDVCQGEIFLSSRHPKDLIYFKGEKKQENFSHYPGAHLQEKIAHAFKREGVSIFAKLEHEFVLILMEAQTGRVYLVRDRFGLEPLYVSLKENKLTFRQTLWREGEVSQAKVLRYLSHWDAQEGPAEENTFYSGVYEVMPGHYTCFSVDGKRESRRYWLPQVRETPASREEIYAVFEKSIRRCTARYTRVGAAVSGGLDSSSVAMTYAHLQGKRIPTFTYTAFDARSEDPYYAQLVNERISSTVQVVSPDLALYSLIEEQSKALSRPMSFIFPPAHQAALSRSARGMEAMLTGHDGDSVIGHGFGHLQHLKSQGQWQQYFEDLKKYLEVRGIKRDPTRVQQEFRYILSRPRQVPAFIKAASQVMQYSSGDFLRYCQHFYQKPPSLSLLRTELVPPAGTPFSSVLNAAFPMLVEELQYWANRNGHTHLFPFFDRELYEACLSVPEDQRFGAGRTRFPFREALKHLLPTELYHRYSKDDAGAFVFSSAKDLLVNHKEKFLDCPALWEYVDKEIFMKGVGQLFNDKIPVNLKRPLVRKLNRVMYLGIWLNTL